MKKNKKKKILICDQLRPNALLVWARDLGLERRSFSFCNKVPKLKQNGASTHQQTIGFLQLYFAFPFKSIHFLRLAEYFLAINGKRTRKKETREGGGGGGGIERKLSFTMVLELDLTWNHRRHEISLHGVKIGG